MIRTGGGEGSQVCGVLLAPSKTFNNESVWVAGTECITVWEWETGRCPRISLERSVHTLAQTV